MTRPLALLPLLCLLACDSSEPAPEAVLCRDNVALVPAYFRAGRAALDATAQERLLDNATVLRGCPNVDIVPTGFVDGCDPDDARDALRLSQARADVVRDFYLANGLAETRLAQSTGRGPDPATSAESGASCAAPVPDARRAETRLSQP